MIKLLLHNYSRSVSPSNPVAVHVETTIQDINELNVMSNSFSADLWFSAIWHDPRLAFARYNSCRQNLSFDDTFEKYLWSPNVCLVNTKMSRVHSSPKPNVLLMLLSNGTVWLNYRVRVEAPCKFRLSDFPMDTVFESYSFNTATVTIDWLPSAAVTLQTDEFSASDFELTHTKHYKHTEYYKAGEWYRLTVEIGFRRRYGYYILQVYANLYINVFISWIAFCISLKALPARVILSVNTLMSLCLQFGNVIGSLPPVSYVKSIDYFMFVCIAFIFASLLEMAFIAYKDKKMVLHSLRMSLGIGSLFNLAGISAASVEGDEYGQQMSRGRSNWRRRTSSSVARGPHMAGAVDDGLQQPGGEMLLISEILMEDDEAPRVQECIVHNMIARHRRRFLARGHRVDQISFVLFPMAFSLFNVIYWTYYLTKSYEFADMDII
uniref:Neur_chan_LBD domain-containing protein n=1 Tax=Globodera pallida TaxID=36090 RepID=A0A183BZH9_GLOPA